MQDVVNQPYGRPLSTVFGGSYKEIETPHFEEYGDPMLPNLRILDYHYVRFCFQPVEDKFSVCGTWMDPAWTNVKSLRRGLDADERESREQAFGANIIDIEEKTIPQILIDEVSCPFRF